MKKILKVKDPFLRLDFGDIFERTESGDYVSTVREDFTNNTDDGSVFTTKYHADFTISEDYAKQMVKDGYLEEVDEKQEAADTNKPFVNVFDEIDTMINDYSTKLENLKSSEDIHPAIAREGEVVYTNLLTALNHLKSLRK